jgi:hypothetical protein
MVESRHEWLNMVSGALLEGKDINVHPYIGLEIVRRKVERVKADILAIEALTKEQEIFVSRLPPEERREYSARLNAAEEKRLTIDSDWRRQMRKGE